MWIKNIIDIIVGIIAFMLCYGVLNQLICRFHQNDIYKSIWLPFKGDIFN